MYPNMTKIKIKNIYYMLSYAFRVLNHETYQDVEVEEFEYVADLLAAILAKGISSQIKRGMSRNYIPCSESLSMPKGKIDISTSIKEQVFFSRKLVCTFDSYEENTYLNQILKSTMLCLSKSNEVKTERKKNLKKLMLYFDHVAIVELKNVQWKGILYSKKNATYKMLINICYLAVNGLLHSDEKGNVKMSKYMDDQQIHDLYQKFILEYYRKHYPQMHPTPSWVKWKEDNGYLELLPIMKTDITLEYEGKTTIIDAKFYSNMFQYNKYNDSKTLHSDNMYQIFAYVKNKDVNDDGSVSGVLLYAKTEGEETLDKTYTISKNQISVKSLDLNQDFKEIKNSLSAIAEAMKL